VIAKVMDRVNTGSKGYKFIKLNTGMDINTRPSLYGARHPLVTVTAETEAKRENEKYIVVGHCCETGDVFTQKEGGEAEEREMERAEIGDYVVMEGCGAYCAGMSAKNYNSYPESAEVLLSKDRKFYLIRARQTLEQIMKNEKVPDYLK
ncbi:MAG TPA: diaminopimelate decarboxylase, partial [Leptospiraceae bacterium]|nr:diaminopimelate decarboxylase [Leptospiraceae bacterium]